MKVALLELSFTLYFQSDGLSRAGSRFRISTGPGFETRQSERADFFVAVKVSDTTMYNRNPAAGNKKIIVFIK